MTSPRDFAAFAVREHPRIVGALTLYTGDPALAEELAQDTFVRIREKWSKVVRADRPAAYTHRVAMNLANSRYRRLSAERRAVAKATAHVDLVQRDPCGADGHAVREAVSALPPRQREAVVRRYFLDESVAQVAQAMAITEGAVKSNTHRGLEALRGLLDMDRASERHEDAPAVTHQEVHDA